MPAITTPCDVLPQARSRPHRRRITLGARHSTKNRLQHREQRQKNTLMPDRDRDHLSPSQHDGLIGVFPIKFFANLLKASAESLSILRIRHSLSHQIPQALTQHHARQKQKLTPDGIHPRKVVSKHRKTSAREPHVFRTHAIKAAQKIHSYQNRFLPEELF